MNRAQRKRLVSAYLDREAWGDLPEILRDGIAALMWHLILRVNNPRDPLAKPVEVNEETGELETFLTVKRVQRCLRETGARRSGEKYAAKVLSALVAFGAIRDAGKDRVMKPEVDPEKRAAAASYKCNLPVSGGRHSQPDLLHSYWWRVFALTQLPRLRISAPTATAWFERRASQTAGIKLTAFLSALVRRQDLIPSWTPTKRFVPGSVQWAFQNSGPP